MKTLLLILILLSLYTYAVEGFKLLLWHIVSLLSFAVKSITNSAKKLSK